VGLEPVNLGAVALSLGFVASCVTDPTPKTRAARGSPGVEGRISTRYGVSPSDVTIAIGNRSIDQWITTHADSSGRFAFERLPPETYYLTADLPTAPRPGRVFRSYYGIVVPSGKRIRIVEPLTLPPCAKTRPCGMLCLQIATFTDGPRVSRVGRRSETQQMFALAHSCSFTFINGQCFYSCAFVANFSSHLLRLRA
jgi:hypothetical protein